MKVSIKKNELYFTNSLLILSLQKKDMMRFMYFTLFVTIFLHGISCNSQTKDEGNQMKSESIQLPSPVLKGDFTLEEVLYKRRSIRSYSGSQMSLQHLSQILWSAYGVTEPKDRPPHIRGGFKTAPSAGARYPLEVYVIVGNVEGIRAGIYRYLPENHSIVLLIEGDFRVQARVAARNQMMVEQAPVTVVYTADFERTTSRYGERGKNYVYVDLGHSAQNVYLQAEALGMHSCAIGAFVDEDINKVMQLPPNETVIYMMPVGERSK